ncbi:MAG TPA: hypothetical protein VNB94_07470 [Mycobacteriales bacterium]|nr:hypothetical protein [Mycobacteriales bacterium]
MVRRRRGGRVVLRCAALLASAAFLAFVGALAAQAQQRQVGDIAVFARVGPPGHPDALAIADDGSVWVGSNGGAQNTPAPSVLTHLSPTGRLLGEITIAGQNVGRDHGLLGIALDDRGALYVVDRAPARILRVDPVTTRQSTYAEIPDLPTCGAPPCEPGPNQVPWPNGAAFAADGALYVADFAQATIFRVPRGGGVAQVWLQDERYISPFGINSLAVDAAGRLLFTTTLEVLPRPTGGAARGGLRRVTVAPDGSAGSVEDLWTAKPGEGPDGLAVAASGDVYVTTLITNQVVALTADGTETARFPADPVGNLALEVPLDNPASIRFAGTRLLITNLSFFRSDPASYAVLDLEVGQPGLALRRPSTARAAQPARPRPAAAAAPAPRPPAPGPLPATGARWTLTVGALLTALAAAALRRTVS